MRRGGLILNRMAGVFARGVRDARGVTSIEFAILAAPFFGLMLLIFQVSLYFYSVQSLDYATRLAGRKIMTGKVSASTTAATFKQNVICPNVFWGITCDQLVINAYVVAKSSSTATSTGIYTFIDAGAKALKPAQTDPTKQSFCLGGPGDYVYLDVAYQYPNYVMRLLSATAGTTMAMRAGSMVYNEPYQSGTRSC